MLTQLVPASALLAMDTALKLEPVAMETELCEGVVSDILTDTSLLANVTNIAESTDAMVI